MSRTSYKVMIRPPGTCAMNKHNKLEVEKNSENEEPVRVCDSTELASEVALRNCDLARV